MKGNIQMRRVMTPTDEEERVVVLLVLVVLLIACGCLSIKWDMEGRRVPFIPP